METAKSIVDWLFNYLVVATGLDKVNWHFAAALVGFYGFMHAFFKVQKKFAKKTKK